MALKPDTLTRYLRGEYGRRRRELLDKAAAGDIQAAVRLDRSDDQRERRHRRLTAAAAGDEAATQFRAKEAMARKIYREESEKRQQGDQEAIERYEQRKQWKTQGVVVPENKTEIERAMMKYGPGRPPPYREEDALSFAALKRNPESGDQAAEVPAACAQQPPGAITSTASAPIDVQPTSAKVAQRRGLRIEELLNPKDMDARLPVSEMGRELKSRKSKLAEKKARLERRKTRLEKRLQEVDIAMAEADVELKHLVETQA